MQCCDLEFRSARSSPLLEASRPSGRRGALPASRVPSPGATPTRTQTTALSGQPALAAPQPTDTDLETVRERPDRRCVLRKQPDRMGPPARRPAAIRASLPRNCEHCPTAIRGCGADTACMSVRTTFLETPTTRSQDAGATDRGSGPGCGVIVRRCCPTKGEYRRRAQWPAKDRSDFGWLVSLTRCQYESRRSQWPTRSIGSHRSTRHVVLVITRGIPVAYRLWPEALASTNARSHFRRTPWSGSRAVARETTSITSWRPPSPLKQRAGSSPPGATRASIAS